MIEEKESLQKLEALLSKLEIDNNLNLPNIYFNIIKLYKKGGIYIKPENRGKFNETKKRTGKTTEELTHSKNPLTRRRAIFAQNAKRWHK